MSILQSILTLILLCGAAYYTFARLRRLAVLINTGVRDENVTDAPAERLRRVLSMTFGHRKVFEDPWAGSLHVFFLYGFFALGVGHLEVVLEGLTAFLARFGSEPFLYERLPFVWPPLITLYRLSQEFFAAAVIVASIVALGRRWSGKVARLIPRSGDAEIILYLIVVLYGTFFLLQGANAWQVSHALGDAPAGRPVSLWVAALFDAWGLPAGAVAALREVGWWAHLLVFLGFACYITTSKHMHLIFAWPNIYAFRRQRAGLPPALEFEDIEKFGIDQVQELPWKSLLDGFACTECGRCNSVCPAHQTGKPLLPMKVLHDIKLNLRDGNADELLALRDARGRPRLDKASEEEAYEPKLPLIAKHAPAGEQVRSDGAYTGSSGQVHVDELWSCTTCGACAEVCPVMIDSVPGTLLGLRQSLVMMESEFPPEMASAFKGMEVQGNPWGTSQDRREEWAESLDVPRADPAREVEYLFWVGCAGATDPRARKTQQALVRVLKAAGVDFAILGCKEKCTGDPARRMGNEYVWKTLAQENVETLDSYKFKKIVASCPHCFNSLKNEYGEIGGEYDVIHHTELLAELLRSGRVPLGERQDWTEEGVTFHDPCYLGRYNSRYDAPREVLIQLGATPTEMPLNRENGFCCGAGGGRVFMEETLGTRVNVARTEQALATGARTVAVGCPFCMTMLTDGANAKADAQTDGPRLQVKDVAELVAEGLAVPSADPPAGPATRDFDGDSTTGGDSGD